MKQQTSVLLLTVVSGFALAAEKPLGVAIAKGTFQIDGSTVSDNATLFRGATIQTGAASSRLQLSGGARIELSPGSRAKIFDDHLTLESGSGELTSKDFQIEAGTLRIETEERKTVARVKIESPKSVSVVALNGSVRVYNGIGLLVANVRPGMALAFEPQAASPTASERTGCLIRSKDDPAKFILVDQVANVTVELRGAGLAEQVGNQVKITGNAFRSAVPVTGASQVVQVTTIELVTTGGCGALVTGGGAVPAAGNPKTSTASTGISSGAKIGIVAAVAGGGAAGVIAATHSSKSR